MFTGLVQTIGRVAAVRRAGRAAALTIEARLPGEPLAAGESIAVDGVCLTVTRPARTGFAATVVAETLACTTLGAIASGTRVNLERSLALGDRLGGHFVLGHVDDTVRVVRVARAAGDTRLRVALPRALSRYVARKGSVVLQGVSLTVAACGPTWLEVALVPETLARTTLGAVGPGMRLNIEVDLLARYLERLAAPRRATPRTR
jgi:riboflavin synthase